MRTLLASALFAALALPACIIVQPPAPLDDQGGDDGDTGDVGDGPGTPDAGPGDGADAAPQGTAYTVSGLVRDYGSADPLASASITSAGLMPPLGATSGMDGAYEILEAPSGILRLSATMAAGYRPTHQEPIDTAALAPGTAITADLHVVSEVYALRQASTMGLTPVPDSSIVIADLRTGEGLPKEGIPLANLKLVDGLGAPVGAGPYFIGPLGDVDAAVITSTAYNGRARVAWLNVPPGEVKIEALFGGGGGGGGGGGTPIVVPVTIGPASSAVLELVKGGGGGGMP